MNFRMRIIAAFFFVLLAGSAGARSALEYLPADSKLDPAIPTPESVLGWDVGDWHVSHDKLVQYMQALAAASPRVSVREIGQTHEQRPLLQVIITTADKQKELEPLRRAHLDGKGPLVLWLGYSVHGDEPSGSNASMLVAYYLAASSSPFVEELLAGAIILIDPSINPDGLNRFASWANSNAGKVPVSNPRSRQHVQHWPEGRTNHYLFDLNRDWLPLVQPESRARIVEYHRWLPHVLTDHHEQDRLPGFFFQPGVPSRQNPLTPAENLELTRALANYHSAALDAAGQPHFTEDAYDDFYYGKGSTYPDINGSIGILFEQRAILGQELATSNGTETFNMAVANQLRVSLSTLKGSWELRERLSEYQAGFAASMLDRASKRDFRAWVVGDDGDRARARAFLDVLDLHGIEYQPLNESIRTGGQEYTPGHAWIIPARQRQFGLLEAMMEQRTEFQDETFYDVSAWTQPLAYNLPFATLSRVPATVDSSPLSSGLALERDVPAWAIPWNQLNAPRLLQQLLNKNAKVRSALKPFSAHTTNTIQSFAAGTLVVQAGIQGEDVLLEILSTLDSAVLDGLEIHALRSTMTGIGPDLGSAHFPIINPVKPLIIGGKGTSSYQAGEIWHLLDQRLGLAAPMIELSRLNTAELAPYTHLLLPDGDYALISTAQKAQIRQWINAGGILLAVNRAASWTESLCFKTGEKDCDEPVKIQTESSTAKPLAYGDFANDKAQYVIGGAIVASVLDLTHPLAFGFQRPKLALLRKGTTLLEASDNAYSTPVHFTNTPLMAGFIGTENLDAMGGQAALIAEKQAKGLVVRFAVNPLFRGFWRGSERLYINALYFGQVIDATKLPEITTPTKP